LIQLVKTDVIEMIVTDRQIVDDILMLVATKIFPKLLSAEDGSLPLSDTLPAGIFEYKLLML